MNMFKKQVTHCYERFNIAKDVISKMPIKNLLSSVMISEDSLEEELKNNPEKFNDDEGNFSDEKYMDYKIEKMNEVTDTTTHTIDLSLTKNAGMWKVDQLSNDDISKLHGLY